MIEVHYQKSQEQSSEDNMQPNYNSLKKIVQQLDNANPQIETPANLNNLCREVNLLKLERPVAENERRESPMASEMNFHI
ncbi:hypothetical protein CsSME_00009845 [Camellia sinensis var. sinensis]